MNLCRRFSQAIVDSYNSKLTSNMPIVILAILVLGARAGPPGLSVGPSLNPQLDADLEDEVALMPLASNPGEHLVVDAETGGYSVKKMTPRLRKSVSCLSAPRLRN